MSGLVRQRRMPPACLCLVLSLGRPNKEMNRSVHTPGFRFQGNCTRVELVGRPVISNVIRYRSLAQMVESFFA